MMWQSPVVSYEQRVTTVHSCGPSTMVRRRETRRQRRRRKRRRANPEGDTTTRKVVETTRMREETRCVTKRTTISWFVSSSFLSLHAPPLICDSNTTRSSRRSTAQTQHDEPEAEEYDPTQHDKAEEEGWASPTRRGVGGGVQPNPRRQGEDPT